MRHAGCAHVVELERAYSSRTAVSCPPRSRQASRSRAELEARRRLHDAVDDLRAPFDQSDARSAIPYMRGAGIDPAHLAEMYAHTAGDGDPPLHPCAWLLVRRGTHGGRVVASHRGGIPARFRSGTGRSSGLIVRRSQVRICPAHVAKA